MIRMVVTDLDDTLLRSDKTISDYTIGVLNACRSKGIKVVFATARSAQAAARYLSFFSPDVFIGYGGALASAGRQTIHRIDIPADVSSRIIKESLATPEVSAIHAINETVAFTNRLDDLSSKDASHYQYTDFLEDYHYRYLKISLTASSQSAVETIAAHYPMCDMLRYTGENLYRFANRDAVKWNAVKAVAAHYDVGADAIAAFGDDVNDVEMLANCGAGVAVENAVDKVKAVAGYFCGSNDEDGVARWLEEYVL